MKKLFSIMLSFILILSLASCGTTGSSQPTETTKTIDSVSENSKTANNKEITLSFSFGERTGKYTGPLNDNGLPEGHGVFTAQNSAGQKWTYTGEFVNGQFEGEGKTEWEGGGFERGTYHNGDIQPLDLTNTLFAKFNSNVDEYKGYYVNFTGVVFHVLGYDENGRIHAQVHQDIENYDNNCYIYSDSSFEGELKEDDYVRIIGRFDGLYEGENALGNKITNLMIRATEIETISYADAASPTIKEVVLDETQTQYGYSVTVQKVEFAKEETRVYIRVENNGKNKFSMYEWNAEAVQNNQQYDTQTNWKANYPGIQSDLRPGNYSEGIITFPALDVSEFKLYLNGSSSDWQERINEMEFTIKVE